MSDDKTPNPTDMMAYLIWSSCLNELFANIDILVEVS